MGEDWVYTWGASVESHKIERKHKIEGIKDLATGNGFKAALTDKGDVYVWGSLKSSSNEPFFDSEEKPKKVNIPNETSAGSQNPMLKMSSMSVGFNHILFLDSRNELYFFGCNDVGQGAFSEREKFSNQVVLSK